MNSSLKYPGSFLTHSEEFEGKEGTFTEEDKVYAKITGPEEINQEQRTVQVKGKTVRMIQEGDEVTGKIKEIYDNACAVEIVTDHATSDSTGFIRISELADKYIESIRQIVQVGDVIKAKVLHVAPTGINLTMKDMGLGVIMKRADVLKLKEE